MFCCRFCFIQLKDDSNVDEVISELNKIKFGNGHVVAERKVIKNEEIVTPEAIDPYTLYVGNLPSTLTSEVFKDLFPNAHRIDIGYARILKFTRYAYIKYTNVDQAIEAYKKAFDMTIGSRSITLRFRRHKGTVGPPGEKPKVSRFDQGGKKKKKMGSEGGGGNQQNGQVARNWNREDAEKALAVELEYQKTQADKSLILSFPDPDLSRDIVLKYNVAIESVYFQSPSSPRFCFIQLKDDSNVDEVISELNKIKFGNGHVVAERKVIKNEEIVTPEAIDPYTLYVGNLPSTLTSEVFKDLFPNAHRIDIGYARILKFTGKYAYIKYTNVDQAIEAYKKAFDMTIGSRSITLRFRRHKGTVGPPGEKPKVSRFDQGGKKKKKMGSEGGGGNQQNGQVARNWNREDAEKALAVELEYQKTQADKSLILSFPDPDLSRDIVLKYNVAIESVYFQSPSSPSQSTASSSARCNLGKPPGK
ncbi:uncharacterized protein LOC120351110 [Nilaparvata lugens]|uniref:uncharacterized protein LOC120351110 n=1 Tax=Nilaparvata lugens TaxID=108931 RepID=UPI00193E6CFE|nr:uncharacterized protein LOC120351110 [Nilaparvata lugens]